MMSNSRFNYLCLTLLFAASFLLLNWGYGYVIVYQSETNDCFFLFGGPFLQEFFDHPAAPLRYAGRFLGQLFHYRWLGALIVSATITCFGFLFHRVLAKLEETVPVSQTLLPCLLLLALHTSTLYVLHDTLGLCMVCGVFLGYLSLPRRTLKRAYAMFATPLVYFCAGIYVWILVAWIVVLEVLESPRRARLGFVAGYAACCIVVPIAAWRWWFQLPLRSVLMCPVMLGPPFRTAWPEQSVTQFVTDCTLAVGLCGVLLVIPFWSRMFAGTSLASFWTAKPSRRTRVTLVCTLGVLGILLHWIRYDGPLAHLVACRQLYKARRWDALLEKARANPYGDHRIQFMTNFALYQQGKLLDEMFRYPQPGGTRGLFMNFTGMPVANANEDDTDDGMYNSDLLYEMGHVNFALRHAYNCLSLQGRTYENLARMAKCSIANGNDATAMKYLRLLEKTLFQRNLARHHMAIMGKPDAEEEEFGKIRERLPTVDGFGYPTRLFLVLLESKPDNRMALEYLMAWLLLEKSPEAVESICADIGHLRDVGRTTLPRHCQEAMLLKAELAQSPVDPQGFPYDTAVSTRVEKFRQDMSGQGDWLDAETAAKLYGDTYMFYWFFATTRTDTLPVADANSRFRVTSREE